jgi:hypothetical protein
MEYGPSTGIDTVTGCTPEPGLMCISGTGARRLNRYTMPGHSVLMCVNVEKSAYTRICMHMSTHARHIHVHMYTCAYIQEAKHVPTNESLPTR